MDERYRNGEQNRLEQPVGKYDRWSQVYQEAVKGKGIMMSMSRKGTPADNAPIASFYSSLKSETFYLEGVTCTTTAIVEQIVREYNLCYNSVFKLN